MIASLALAVALADFPPASVGPIPVETECARPEKLKPALPKAHKPGLVVKHKPKRLFKSDPKPKPEEEPCAALPPAPPFTFKTEPEPQYSLPVEPEFPPLYVVPMIPLDEPIEPEGAPVFAQTSTLQACCWQRQVVTYTPAVPEPSTALLLLAGLGFLRIRVGRK